MKSGARTLDVAAAVGKVTFFEIVRDKVLYNIVVFALLLLGVGFLAARLTFIRPDRVVIDFGISALNISCAMVSVLIGAGMLPRELERRTIYVALSHPVSRPQFVFGKFAGLSAVLAVNWLLLSLAFLVILALTGEGLGENFHFTLIWALVSIFLQGVLLASLSVLFSTFSTTSLAAMITIGLYLIGNNVSQIRLVASKLKSPAAAGFFNSIAMVVPNLEHFSLGTKVIYGLPVTWQFAFTAVVYCGVFTALALVLAGLLIQAREV